MMVSSSGSRLGNNSAKVGTSPEASPHLCKIDYQRPIHNGASNPSASGGSKVTLTPKNNSTIKFTSEGAWAWTAEALRHKDGTMAPIGVVPEPIHLVLLVPTGQVSLRSCRWYFLGAGRLNQDAGGASVGVESRRDWDSHSKGGPATKLDTAGSTFAPSHFSPSSIRTPTLIPHSSIMSSNTIDAQHGFVGALDCGTTSTRFIIFDPLANIVAEHQLEFPQYYPQPGWHSHKAEEIAEVSKQCIEGAVEKLKKAGYEASSVKAIGITNQRETAVAWSKKTGKPLCDAIVWDDSRNKGEVLHYENTLKDKGIEIGGKLFKGQEAVDALAELTGLKLSTYFSAIKLHWMIKNYPEVAAAHEADDLLFGTVDSWVLYELTGGAANGGLHLIDVTNASRTLLMDLATLTFSPDLLKFFSFRPSILPKIVSSSQVYGKIHQSFSPSLAGVPIGGIVGDQQAALVGNKCFKDGEAKNTYGTGAFLLFNTGEKRVGSKNGLLTTVAYQDGEGGKVFYALEGSIGVAGSAVKWLRDQMGMIQSAPEVNVLAESVPDAGGVYFVTAFSGLLAPYWDTGAGGMLIGISQYTRPAHIARATLEAVSYMTRAVIDAMRADSGVELKHLMVDGGMTNGDVVMQIQADVGGFEVVRPEMRESTALGSALLAGSAIRFAGWDVSKPETLKDVNTKGSTSFKPKIDEATREKGWKAWKRAVEKSCGWEDVVDTE
ncbi:glycerol kinase [Clavulina sp. PMI_390]|nr:glycerol kinase [Clavulina sp. PMI_390]